MLFIIVRMILISHHIFVAAVGIVNDSHIPLDEPAPEVDGFDVARWYSHRWHESFMPQSFCALFCLQSMGGLLLAFVC
eukprot:SAG31_NODE_4029_length_3650_cov_1.509716_2_plen_78_part_00